MDRNAPFLYPDTDVKSVATREGGVDRNTATPPIMTHWRLVATREGGVDRNCTKSDSAGVRNQSPPARVAWIETPKPNPEVTETFSRHPRGWRG